MPPWPPDGDPSSFDALMTDLSSAVDVPAVVAMCGKAALAGAGGAIAVECVSLLFHAANCAARFFELARTARLALLPARPRNQLARHGDHAWRELGVARARREPAAVLAERVERRKTPSLLLTLLSPS